MELLTLHDILTCWQDGGIDEREAIRLARIDTGDGLREAAEFSEVAPPTGWGVGSADGALPPPNA